MVSPVLAEHLSNSAQYDRGASMELPQCQVTSGPKRCSSLVDVWCMKWTSSYRAKIDVIATPIMLILMMCAYTQYLNWNETRTDVEFISLSDPILPTFVGLDFSMPLFFLAYGSVLLGALHFSDKPDLILEFLQTKALVVLIRMVCLYLTPFDAPKGTILLVDPLAQGFKNSPPLVRDLFFSGHTATIFVVFFTCRTDHWRWKMLFLSMGLVTGMMVILQKTHFVIDVWSAPFFSYAGHRIIYNLRSYGMTVYDP